MTQLDIQRAASTESGIRHGARLRQASQPPKPFELFTVLPAGSMTSSGRRHGALHCLRTWIRITTSCSKPETTPADARHRPDCVGAAQPNGPGFLRADLNGRKLSATVATHSGSTVICGASRSEDRRVFLPEQRGARAGASLAIREALIHDVMNRYFPAPVDASAFQPRPA